GSIGLELVECYKRCESVGGFAHDVKLGSLLQQLAERSSHFRVIVGDQNPERPRRREDSAAERAYGRVAAHVKWRLDLALRLASGRDQAEPRPLPGGALD